MTTSRTCHMFPGLQATWLVVPRTQVVIRVRPPLHRELQALHPYENTVAVDAAQRVITLSENLASLQGASSAAGTASVDNGMVRPALPLTNRPSAMLTHDRPQLTSSVCCLTHHVGSTQWSLSR